LAILVPVVEFSVGVALILPSTSAMGAIIAVPVLGVFSAFLATDDRPAFSNCGCAGSKSVPMPRSSYLFRNAVLMAVALGAAGLSLSQPYDSSVLHHLLGVGLAFPLALVVTELPLIFHVFEVDRKNMPARLAMVEVAAPRVI
jgi:hypothetical protein